MPDLSLFKPLCEELDITINELMNGENLSIEENQENLNDGIIKLTEYVQLKSMRNGLLGMLVCFFIMFCISVYKNISQMPLVCLLCAFNSFTYLSRYKIDKNNLVKVNLFLDLLFTCYNKSIKCVV